MMKKHWIMFGICCLLSGCSYMEEDFVTFEASATNYYGMSEQEVITQNAFVYFRSNQKVESAEVIEVQDLSPTGLLDPAFVSLGFEIIDEKESKEKGELYRISFNVNFKNHNYVEFSQLRIRINGVDYDTTGHYIFDYRVSSDHFMTRHNTSSYYVEPAVSLDNYQIPKEAQNYKVFSSDERVEFKTLEAKEYQKGMIPYEITLEEPYVHYYTTLELEYELDGVMYRKFLPEPFLN